MDTLLQDIRYAARKLVRSPGFTSVAALTLGLAIGATTVTFSVVNGVLLRPLPFEQPERLVQVTSMNKGNRFPMSSLDFMDYRQQSKSVASMVPIDNGTLNLTGRGDPERVAATWVGANFWTMLGVQPAVGRGFTPSEDQPGVARVAVLSDAYWHRRFGGDPKVIGQSITLDGNPVNIVGVAPAGFTYPDNGDVWLPLVFEGEAVNPENRGAHYLSGIGRLAPAATIEQADRELRQIADGLAQQYPVSNTNFSAGVVSLRDYTVGSVSKSLLIMLGAVTFVLLIACANVANLLLVRAASRSVEMAVRTALGAGRVRIVRQLVTESLMLALLGAGIGVLIATWGVDLLKSAGPQNLPRLSEVRIDGDVLMFSVSMALVTGVLFGLVPAIHASRPNLHEMLKEGARGSSRGGGRVRNALVVAEMALAVVLLIGAGLLIRSFGRLLDVDLGFRTDNVYTYSVTPPDTRYSTYASVRTLARELTDRAKSLPGAQSVGATMILPLSRHGMRTLFEVEGTPPSDPSNRRLTDVAVITPGYFETVGITLREGRAFTEDDRMGRHQVVIVTEALAKRYFPNENALGKRIELGIGLDTNDAAPGGEYTVGGEIVGIAADVRTRSVAEEPRPLTFVPYDQSPFGTLNVVVRTAAQPAVVAAAARAQVRSIDPDLPLYDFRSLDDVLSTSVAQPRFYTLLLGAFAAIALVLAAVGIYGVISYTVSQRTRELGIRVALGATGGQVLRMVLGRGLLLTAGGVVIGLVAAFWLTRLIASLLFGVEAFDPLTFASVSGVLLAVAALASYVPARRAAKVDPVVALRYE